MASPRSPYATYPPSARRDSPSSYWRPSMHGPYDKGSPLDRFFDRKDLPLYKDKPHSYATSNRAKPYWKRRPVQMLIMLAVVGVYWVVVGMESNTAAEKLKSELHWPPHKSTNSTPLSASKLRAMVRKADIVKDALDWETRQQCVKEAFRLSWDAYARDAWGMDEYHPVSKAGDQITETGVGLIIVDALDSLILMNLTSRLAHARDWITTSLNFAQDEEVNTFETTVRTLGGLLSAHYLTNRFPDLAALDDADEDLFIEKATDLADRLVGAFDSESGVPYGSVNLDTRKAISSDENEGATPLAEAGGMTLEWKYLSKLLGEHLYWELAEKVMQIVDDHGAQDGLVPAAIDPVSGDFVGSHIKISGAGGAYYESLLKQYLLTSKHEPVYRTLWDQALAGMRKHLLTYSASAHLSVIAEQPEGPEESLDPRMEQRACFLPGAIALRTTEGTTVAAARRNHAWGPQQESELRLARELTKTCWGMSQAMDTGLAPEAVQFDVDDPPLQEGDEPLTSKHIDWTSKTESWRDDYHVPSETDGMHRQRPDVVKTLFYMYRITGDELYREWAWTLFKKLVEHTQLESGGFAALQKANQLPAEHADSMESWWMGSTLKYFYLLFGEKDVLPLDQVVFNTEGHPFPIFELKRGVRTGWKRKERDEEGRIVPKREGGGEEDNQDEEVNGDEDRDDDEEEKEKEKEDDDEEEEEDDEEDEEEDDENSDDSDGEENDDGEEEQDENKDEEHHEEEGEGKDNENEEEEDEEEGERTPSFALEPMEDNQPEEDVEEEWSWSIRELL